MRMRAVVLALAGIQAQVDIDAAVIVHTLAPILALFPALPAASACRHPRYDVTASPCPGSALVPLISGLPTPPTSGDTTFSIIIDRGPKSCRSRRPEASLRGHEEGNGGGRPSAVSAAPCVGGHRTQTGQLVRRRQSPIRPYSTSAHVRQPNAAVHA